MTIENLLAFKTTVNSDRKDLGFVMIQLLEKVY